VNDLAMSGVITASEPSWITPFTGLSPRCFSTLVTALRREGAAEVRRGHPWGRPLPDRVLLVAAYWRNNLTMRQLAPLFGVSKTAAGRVTAIPPNHQVVIDADTRLVVTIGRPVPGNRNDYKAWALSGRRTPSGTSS
jgi:hypothetical protein